jgi:GDPmannose 4,6-dehydratase
LKNKVLITGITGQDGGYLSKFLYDKNLEIYGMIRRTSDSTIIDMIKKQMPNIKLMHGDMCDSSSMRKILAEIKPDYLFNLAAQSHVGISFDMPEYTSDVNGTGVVSLLDAVKDMSPETRIYQASTSELYGSTTPPQSEATPFHPRSPYGVAKLQAYWAMINYRESYDMFTSQGIAFNHESPFRGYNFVTRKITSSLAKIKLNKQDCLYMGNLDAKRDWGFAGDFCEAMWMIINHTVPDDFVIATGKSHSVREFLEKSFEALSIKAKSNGEKGLNEVYYDEKGKPIVKIDSKFFRPAEVNYLMGDITKIKNTLGWEPKVDFEKLIEMMCLSDFDKEIKKRD